MGDKGKVGDNNMGITHVKAKSANCWVYGVAIRHDGKCKIYQENEIPISIKEYTICRATDGVDDADDLIYENDIIEYKMPHCGRRFIAKVFYNEQAMKWCVSVITSEQKCYWDLGFIVNEAEELKIKGNVFD